MMIPYAEAILQTMVGALRFEDESSVQVKLFINRRKRVADIKDELLQDHNSKIRNGKIANALEFVAKFGLPVIFLTFITSYFIIGYFLI